MKKIALLLIITAHISAVALCQLPSISGTVYDSASKEPVPFCNILWPGYKSVTANAEGQFSFEASAKPYVLTLIITSAGYAPDTLQAIGNKNRLEIYLLRTASLLKEVVVTTAVARAIPIKENPIPVVVVSSRSIDQAIESNIVDAFAFHAPGFNSVKTGPGVSKPFIHGLGYNRVLTLYDGVRQESQQWGDEHGIVVDDYNIDHAEIVKGPASLMYGSDALAGVMSLFPVKAQSTEGRIIGRLTTEYQSNNGLAGNGMRLLFGKNRWCYALRGSYRIARNYYNAADGWVYNSNFRTSNISFTAGYKSSRGKINFNLNLYDHKQGIPDGSRDSLSRRFTRQIFETEGSPADQVKARPLVSSSVLRSYALSDLHQRIQDYKIYVNSHHLLGKGSIDGQLAFTRNERREYNHPTDPEQAGMYVRLHTVNYGIRYGFSALKGTECSVGLNGMYQTNKNLNGTDFPIPDFTLFDAGAYVYMHHVFNKLALTGGIRWDNRMLMGSNFYTRQDSLSGFVKQVHSTDTAGAYLQFPAFQRNFRGLSFSVGLTYQISEKLSLKMNLARGFRAPNISELASNGLDPGAHIVYLGNKQAVPEFSLQEDLGIEGRGNSFSFSFGLFNNNIQHYIYESQLTNEDGQPIVIVPGNKTFRYQQATAHLFGAEGSILFNPEELKHFSIENAFSIVYGFNLSSQYKNKGVNGEYLPLMPPARWLTTISREFIMKSSVLKSLTLRIQSDANAAQNHFLALNQTETATPGYHLFNAGCIASIQHRKSSSMQFQIQVNNLFDRIYQSNLSRLKYSEFYTQSPNGRLGIYNMGRNICVKLIIPFS